MITETMIVTALTSTEVVKFTVACAGTLTSVILSKVGRKLLSDRKYMTAGIALIIISIGLMGEVTLFTLTEAKELVELIGRVFHLY